MPSVEQNRTQWANHDWSSQGDEWSVGYGGTEAMWAWTIQPRIGGFLPADRVLEIAPGFGRITQYLIPACRELTVVDLTERCIEACQESFADVPNIEFHVNDGKSLDMVADDSVDFVFSWDSLIHAEDDVLQAYLSQLGKKLRPGGHGIFHHSNIDAHRTADGSIGIENTHWRADSMSAAKFRTYCDEAGLRCTVQELIPWGGEEFTDCLSVFERPAGRSWRRPKPVLIENHDFFRHVQEQDARGVRSVTSRYW